MAIERIAQPLTSHNIDKQRRQPQQRQSTTTYDNNNRNTMPCTYFVDKSPEEMEEDIRVKEQQIEKQIVNYLQDMHQNFIQNKNDKKRTASLSDQPPAKKRKR